MVQAADQFKTPGVKFTVHHGTAAYRKLDPRSLKSIRYNPCVKFIQMNR